MRGHMHVSECVRAVDVQPRCARVLTAHMAALVEQTTIIDKRLPWHLQPDMHIWPYVAKRSFYRSHCQLSLNRCTCEELRNHHGLRRAWPGSRRGGLRRNKAHIELHSSL
eukprot:4481148-Pyramimonas_sp.AAC.1